MRTLLTMVLLIGSTTFGQGAWGHHEVSPNDQYHNSDMIRPGNRLLLDEKWDGINHYSWEIVIA